MFRTLIVFLYLFAYSQNVGYKIDTIYFPKRILDYSKYPVKRVKYCFDLAGRRASSCSIQPFEGIKFDGNRIFVYQILDIYKAGEPKEVMGAFRIYAYYYPDYNKLFDTIIKTYNFYPMTSVYPYFVGDSIVMLVNEDVIIYNYKNGRYWSLFSERYKDEKIRRKNLIDVFYSLPGENIFINDKEFYLGVLPLSRSRKHKEVLKWHKLDYKPLYRCSIRNNKMEKIDSIGNYPIFYRKPRYFGQITPMVIVDSVEKEIYISYYYHRNIYVYNEEGYLLRIIPRIQKGDYLPLMFIINGNYLYLFWLKYGVVKSDKFIRVLDRKTRERVGELLWDEKLKEIFYNNECILGMEKMKDGINIYFLDNKDYISNSDKMKVYKVKILFVPNL